VDELGDDRRETGRTMAGRISVLRERGPRGDNEAKRTLVLAKSASQGENLQA